MKRSLRVSVAGFSVFCLFLAPLLADTWEERNADRHVLSLSMDRDVEIFPDFSYKSASVTRYKVQSPEAIKNGFGEFQREYNPRFDKLKMEAVIVTPEGKRIHHRKVQDKARSGDNAVYDDTRVVTLTLPRLTVGSTVELIVSHHNFKPRVHGQVEFIRQIELSVAVKNVHHSLTWPQGMDLSLVPLNGLEPGKSTVQGGKHKQEWFFQESDEIPEESHMPPMEQVTASLGVSYWKDWSQMDAFFAPVVEGSAKVTPPIQKLAEDIMAKSTSTADRIQEVFNYIDDNIRYVSMNLGQNGLTPHPAEETLKNRYGDCKDRAALAIAVLKALGVKAYPCLVAPELPDIDDRLPRWGYFNHMIAAVEFEGLHFVESTDNNFPFNEQHPGLNGAQVFLVDGQGGKRFALPSEDVTRPGYGQSKRIQLLPDGSGRLEQTEFFPRHSTPEIRQGLRHLESMPELLATKMKQEFLTAAQPGILDGAFDYAGVDQRFGRIQARITGRAPGIAKKNGPFLVYDLDIEDRMQGFPESPRVHPLWFSDTDYAHTEAVVQLPAGYAVEHLPRDFDMKTDAIRFKRSCKLEGDTFTVVEDRWLSPARLPATEYPRLRQFHQELKTASEDSLILRELSVKEARKP
jgi:transglutaminase-like putative cysteine protease